jgi:hypothetical protein
MQPGCSKADTAAGGCGSTSTSTSTSIVTCFITSFIHPQWVKKNVYIKQGWVNPAEKNTDSTRAMSYTSIQLVLVWAATVLVAANAQDVSGDGSGDAGKWNG